MSDKKHQVPLWGLFLALLALTAAEVVLFEVWSRNQWLMPKYAMVLLLLIFTLPKVLIVLIYFMHLKFERPLVVILAIIPFILCFVAVLPILTDIITLRSDSYNNVEGLREFNPVKDHADDGEHEVDDPSTHNEEH